ncbi:aldehyde dehydrogenase family protein [Actinomadura rugatobispora]|uniref:Aldehyde dehydrogenase family protein n=1 Tax=Actinomadura rugatobispora TaxID=1994 RepID=A0ABW0ZYU3_9ACTN
MAERVVREVRTGQIFVNDASMCVTQPFGGFSQPGMGREGGPEGSRATSRPRWSRSVRSRRWR